MHQHKKVITQPMNRLRKWGSAVVIASDCTSQTYDEDSAVVIASDCASQTYDEDQPLNESVAAENVSVNLE